MKLTASDNFTVLEKTLTYDSLFLLLLIHAKAHSNNPFLWGLQVAQS